MHQAAPGRRRRLRMVATVVVGLGTVVALAGANPGADAPGLAPLRIGLIEPAPRGLN